MESDNKDVNPMANDLNQEFGNLFNMMCSPEKQNRDIATMILRTQFDGREWDFHEFTEQFIGEVLKYSNHPLIHIAADDTLELRALPQNGLNIFSWIHRLKIYNNFKYSLSNDVFSGMSQLMSLSLGNRIQKISSKSFRGIDNLIYLDLSHNNIKSLPRDIFDYLPNLKNIYLNNNQIFKLPQEIFKNNQFLEFIGLHGNPINEIPVTTFKHLKYLKSINIQGCPISDENQKSLESELPSVKIHL